MNDLLIRACRRQEIPRPPVWIMRQAGRVLPAYRALRERVSFMTLLSTPDLAVEVTLQPIEALGVDAAIMFSDILIVPQAMGMDLEFVDGVGPRFANPIRSGADIAALGPVAPEAGYGSLLEALRLTRRALGGAGRGRGRVPLIGFAGAPWTLATYMIEGGGGSAKHYRLAKRLLRERPSDAHVLLTRLAEAVGDLLVAQVEAGAEVMQVFDSAAGALGPDDYRVFGMPYLAAAIRPLRDVRPDIPVIVFALGAGWALEELYRTTGADVMGVDWHEEARDARQRLQALGVGMQGNLDPTWLYAAPNVIRDRTTRMLEACAGPGYIANLGHGILPDTPVEHVRVFVDTVRNWAAEV